MRLLLALCLFVPDSFAAPSCDLDDCHLAAHLHAVNGVDEVAAYGWLLHDLAMSRQALRDRDIPRAGQLAASAHLALTLHADRVAAACGAEFVSELHLALSEVLVLSGRVAPEAPALR